MAGYRVDDRKRITTGAGTIEYRDIGGGKPVVFVHGPFVNGALWDDVVFYLPLDLRLLRLDLPLGGHRTPMEGAADLTSSGMAALLLEFVEALDLHEVILVGNDIGCLICRLASGSTDRRVDRISGMLLTNCDPSGRLRHWCSAGAKLGAKNFDALAAKLSSPDGRRAFFEHLVWTQPPDEQLNDLLGRFAQDPGIRFDTLGALRNTNDVPSITDRSFGGPVRIVWGANDPFFSLEVGQELAECFVDSSFRSVQRSRLLLPLDQPEVLAEGVLDIVEHTTRGRRSGCSAAC